ncbi:MAG: MBL fold metallo-hydrolase [Lachnospiraceae bacterium]|nr:MBL fold metallo-hydrolase [Lachnospiraceae bacterium]MBR0307200.1 MBL fold metallo-hydrolase [Lachnospiraceae bacterium]
MRFVSIASGSSGNCIYAGTDSTHILIDAGISAKRIEKGLFEVGLKPGELSGICITHEHSDHIKGLGVLARKYEIPIYATEGTLAEIRNVKSLGEYPEELLKPLRPDVKMTLGDLDILPFHIDHDAADPVAYRVQSGNKSVAVATDLGHYNQYTIDHLLDLDAVLLESNHDLRMLESGPYPYYLKRRIMGNFGHLSNENAGRLLNCILNDKMKYVLLGHLSKENNLPELAFETVRLEVDMGDCPYCTSDFYMTVAERDEMSEIMTL